jgi:hypothetical protein
MTNNKPLAIGLCVAALVLLGVVIWKYMLPHNAPAGPNEPLVPGAANYGPGAQAPSPR